ncbi:hypothetical protein SRHO_G00100960 [Serrasalmus rhombeus]
MTENGMEAGGNRLESDGASGDGHHHTQHLQHESTFCTEVTTTVMQEESHHLESELTCGDAQQQRSAVLVQIAVIEARITAIASTTRAVTVRGSEKKLRHATIFDGTARILLQLWEKHTDAVPILSFHRPVNPKVPRSVATDNHFRHRSGDHRRPGCAGHILRQFRPALMSATGTVTALQTETSMQCFFCNSKQDNIDAHSKFHRCQQCKLNQKSDSYGQLFSGTMMLTTNNGILHLKISPETFTAYFNVHNLKRTLEDELEEHFLSQSHVSVTFDEENQDTFIHLNLEHGAQRNHQESSPG